MYFPCVYVYVCQYVCVLSAVWWWLLLAWWTEEGRRRAHVTTHLLVALYKARRGGRERRANRYWQGTLWNKGRPMLPAADSNSTPMRSSKKRSQHADSVRGYATSPSPSHSFWTFFFFFSCAFHTGPAGLVRPCQKTDNTQPPQPNKSDIWHTPQTHGTCSSIRRTGPNAESDSNQTESEAERIGSVRVEEYNLLLLDQRLEVKTDYCRIEK